MLTYMEFSQPVPPLVATADEVLLDDVLRLCAGAAVTPDVAADLTDTRRLWRSAGLVIVGQDLAEMLAAVDVPRRDGVIVVTRRSDDASVWQTAVRVRAEQVVVLPADERRLAERIADTVDATSGRAVTIAVIGGRGGAGSSLLAAALAVSAGRSGRRTLLVDADPLGGGIDLAVGGEDAQGLRWPDLAGTTGRVSAAALRSALPEVSGIAVLSWDRGDRLEIPPECMRTVLAAGQRGCDLVVVDLPRRIDGAAAEAVAGAGLTALVVPAEVRAVASAGRVREQLRRLSGDVRLVPRLPGPSGITSRWMSDTLDLAVLCEVRTDHRTARDVEEGFGPVRRSRGSLLRGCEEILAAVFGEQSAA